MIGWQIFAGWLAGVPFAAVVTARMIRAAAVRDCPTLYPGGRWTMTGDDLALILLFTAGWPLTLPLLALLTARPSAWLARVQRWLVGGDR